MLTYPPTHRETPATGQTIDRRAHGTKQIRHKPCAHTRAQFPLVAIIGTPAENCDSSFLFVKTANISDQLEAIAKSAQENISPSCETDWIFPSDKCDRAFALLHNVKAICVSVKHLPSLGHITVGFSLIYMHELV